MTYKEMLHELCNTYNSMISEWVELTDEAKNEQVYVAKFWRQDGEFVRKASFSFGVNVKPVVDEQSTTVQVACLRSWDDIRTFPSTVEEQIAMCFNGGMDYEPELEFEGTFKEYKDWTI